MAMRITIVDPDSDDQMDAKWKSRNNGDGNLRSTVEAEVLEVQEGRQYLLRVTVLDLATGQETTVETPPLIVQPPR